MSSQAPKLRISTLSAIIWRKSGEKGAWYSVKLKRSHKTEDDQRRDTDALGQDDLLPAVKLLDQAHTWITDQLAAGRKAYNDGEAA